ncbi:hypothetical protein GPALN_010639 [Globodera pallida]|nr:hypothetical protein GPALN_010639 [Globodera pallida]
MTTVFRSAALPYSILVILATIELCHGLDKSKAVGPCLKGGQCPPGHFCAGDNECYPKKAAGKKFARRDVPQKDNIGPCVNGLCPKGYECRDDACFKVKAPPGSPKSLGPCVNNKCPDGYSCDQSEYKCFAH